MNRVQDLININERKGLPRTYRFNPLIRWFTILLALAVIVYSIWVILYKISSDSSTFYKIVPFIILFLAFNTLLKNLLSVNSIRLSKQNIQFRYLVKPAVSILLDSIIKISLHDSRPKGIKFHYKEDDQDKNFLLILAFPRILEIVNSIAELCPDIEYDEFIKNIIITDIEKKVAQKQKVE